MALVSFFRAPASSIVPYKDITLVDIYHYITGPYAAERTAKLRSIDDKKTKGLWKRTKFDYVTFPKFSRQFFDYFPKLVDILPNFVDTFLKK